jgi:hypothetical protein
LGKLWDVGVFTRQGSQVQTLYHPPQNTSYFESSTQKKFWVLFLPKMGLLDKALANVDKLWWFCLSDTKVQLAYAHFS